MGASEPLLGGDTISILTFTRELQGECLGESKKRGCNVWSTMFLLVFVVYLIFLFGMGMAYNSLLLLSACMHTFSDLIAYSAGLWMQHISESPASITRPFGSVRAEVIGGVMCGTFIFVSSVFVLVGAFEAIFLHPPEASSDSHATAVVTMGAAGIGVNLLCAMLMVTQSGHGHSHGGHTHGGKQGQRFSQVVRGMLLHIFTDFVTSIIVLSIGLAQKYAKQTAWNAYLDPAGSILIAAVAMCLAFPILKRCTIILLQVPPSSVDVGLLLSRVTALAGVVRVVKLNVWELGDAKGTTVGTCTIVAGDGHPHNQVKEEVKSILNTTISTVEVDYHS